MHFRVIFRVLGVLLMFFSVSMLPPVGVALYYGDDTHPAFLIAGGLTAMTGVALWLVSRSDRRDLRVREGFLVVVLSWSVLSAFGAIPLHLVSEGLSVTDAVFESVSGLTTTGATVLTGIDELPAAIRYHRQQLQWLGGLGIIVLAVAVLPMLGIGGMQLYRAETPGPMKDTKLTPRITETAKALWYIYLGLTAVCAVAYRMAGMDWFDAIGHSFSTVATGGFSTHDASIGHFDSAVIETITVVFMVLGSLSFALHFVMLRSRNPLLYLRDPEVKVFFGLLSAAIVICTLVLVAFAPGESILAQLRVAVFQVVSLFTTTGFTTADYSSWPIVLPVLVVVGSFVGGCAGGTTGGMKVMRIMLLYLQGAREFSRLVHPNAVIPIKLGGRPISDSAIHSVWAFFSLYMLCFVVLTLIMIGTGLDFVSGVGAVIACLNNLGPGLGIVSATLAEVSDFGKWLMSFAMLLGRLELFTLLVLFTRAFWRA
jgi:trk system potassium uptake protein